jgi:hypothetical protein
MNVQKSARRVHKEIDAGDLDDMLSAAEHIKRSNARAREKLLSSLSG